MSAFIVSDVHINALVAFAVGRRVSYFFANVRTDIDSDNAEHIGRVLLAENVASVSYRYKQISDEELNAANNYQLAEFHHGLTAVEAIKQCHCLEYQSCEHPEWEASEAYAILQAIIKKASYDLPGYDPAPWGIDSDSPRPKPLDIGAAAWRLLDWARENTSPRDPNSPHEILLQLARALKG